MIREYNQYSLCKHLNSGMSNGIKYDSILETKLIK
jgi:hypothetical protein